ncbi:MAG: PIN domain-containing protein [Nanoarchaeota archaeon]
MNNIVLDTDIFVDFFRSFGKALTYFEKLKDSDNIVYYSAVTEAELISGKECNKIEKKAKILDFLSNFTKVNVNNEIAIKAGDFSRINNIETADAIIAATAFFMKAALITRNVNDYGRVKEITIKVPY